MKSTQSQQFSPCGKIGPLNELHQLFDVRIRMFDHMNQSVNDLAQVVWRNVGCHSNRNPGGPIDEQVGNTRRQDNWLAFAAIVVVFVINRIFVDVTKHFGSDFFHSCFGITHRCSTITVDRAKVSVTIDQGITVTKILGHTDHRFVNTGVSMRVKFPHDIPHQSSGFFIRATWHHIEFAHAIQNTALHGF